MKKGPGACKSLQEIGENLIRFSFLIPYPIDANQIGRHRQRNHQKNGVRDSNQHRNWINFHLQLVQPHPSASSDSQHYPKSERDLKKKKKKTKFQIFLKNFFYIKKSNFSSSEQKLKFAGGQKSGGDKTADVNDQRDHSHVFFWEMLRLQNVQWHVNLGNIDEQSAAHVQRSGLKNFSDFTFTKNRPKKLCLF